MGALDHCRHCNLRLNKQTKTPKFVQIRFTCEKKTRVRMIPEYYQCSPIKSKIQSVVCVMSYVPLECVILSIKSPETAGKVKRSRNTVNYRNLIVI